MLLAVIFDFDGVLANSEPLHYEAFRRVLAGASVELGLAEYYEKYLGYDDAGAFRAVLQDRGQPAGDDRIASLVRTKLDVFPTVLDGRNILFPGAAECVARLSSRVPLAIASGALTHDIDLILAGSGLRAAFPVVVGADQTTRSKPDPEPYARALALLQERGLVPAGTGAAGRTVAIEDSRWGLVSARGAGLRTVAVTTSYSRAELEADADLVVGGLEDVSIDRLEALLS
jgi:beta-phosphoglucomutase-like phosphatase (HAD superfamily)